MSRHNFFYFAREGAYNMFNHGFMSFAAIGVTVACLLIMGTFTLVAVNANAMLEDMEQKNQVLAFVDENLTEEEARALADDLEAVDNVAGVTFISREEAMENFQSKYPEEELYQDLTPEIFRHRYAIDLLAAGKLGGEPPAFILKAHQIQHIGDPFFDLLGASPHRPHGKHHIVIHRLMLNQAEILENDTYCPAKIGNLPLPDVPKRKAVDHHLSLGRLHLSDKDLYNRTLPAAGRTHHKDEFPILDLHGKPV